MNTQALVRKFYWCFFFRCGSERVEETHQHEHHTLVVFTEGKYYGRAGGKSFEAGAGDIVLYRIPRRFMSSSSTAMRIFHLSGGRCGTGKDGCARSASG